MLQKAATSIKWSLTISSLTHRPPAPTPRFLAAKSPSPLSILPCVALTVENQEIDFVVDKLPTLFLREEIFLSFFLFVLCPRSKRKKHGFCAEVVHCGQPYLILENESKPIFVPFGPKKIIFVSSNLIFCSSFVCLG